MKYFHFSRNERPNVSFDFLARDWAKERATVPWRIIFCFNLSHGYMVVFSGVPRRREAREMQMSKCIRAGNTSKPSVWISAKIFRFVMFLFVYEEVAFSKLLSRVYFVQFLWYLGNSGWKYFYIVCKKLQKTYLREP